MFLTDQSSKIVEYFLTIPNDEIIYYNITDNYGGTVFICASYNLATFKMIIRCAKRVEISSYLPQIMMVKVLLTMDLKNLCPL